MPDSHTRKGSDHLEQQRIALERLRDLMNQTRTLYESAKDVYDKALEEFKKNGGTPPAVLMDAANLKDALRDNYINALRAYNHFVLRSVGALKLHSEGGSDSTGGRL